MVLREETYVLQGKKIVLRSATVDDAEMLLAFLKQVTGETRFLMSDSDEVTATIEDEIDFIQQHQTSDSQLLILAYVDGAFAGDCSFKEKNGSRRESHRARIGIALLQKFTGFGLGRLMLQVLIRVIQECGYEQVELDVVGGNDRAYHLYQSLGFIECGRIPHAFRYEDGTYADDISMVLPLRKE